MNCVPRGRRQNSQNSPILISAPTTSSQAVLFRSNSPAVFPFPSHLHVYRSAPTVPACTSPSHVHVPRGDHASRALMSSSRPVSPQAIHIHQGAYSLHPLILAGSNTASPFAAPRSRSHASRPQLPQPSRAHSSTRCIRRYLTAC